MSETYIPFSLSNLVIASWQTEVQLVTDPERIYAKYLAGSGELTFINGLRYEGQLKLGMINGKGKLIWPDGTVYEGSFSQNSFTGDGKITWVDGSCYEGQLLEGLKHGKGVLTCQQYRYQGEWVNNLKHGLGKLIFKNGTIYQGSFKEGLRSGVGTCWFSSGNHYHGQWLNDKKDGQGVMNWVAAKQKYKGSWKNDLQEGVGQHIWLELKGDFKQIRNRYMGEWSKGKRRGKGVFFSSSGCIWIGEWSENKKQGRLVQVQQVGRISLRNYQKDHEINPARQKLNFGQNVYRQMLDFQDIIHNHSPQLDMLYNLLLRNNSTLRTLYRHLALSSENSDQHSLLTLSTCWRLVRQLRLLSDKISLANLNRLLYQNPKNRFRSSYEVDHMADIARLASLRQRMSFEQMEQAKLIMLTLDQSAPCWHSQPQPSAPNVLLQKFNIHFSKNIIIYRIFVQFLVRLAYLQNPDDFLASLNALIIKITAYIEKSSNPNPIKEDSQIKSHKSNRSARILNDVPSYASTANLSLFNQITKGLTNSLFQDRTIRVLDLFSYLQGWGYLRDISQKALVLARLDSFMSHDDQVSRRGRKKTILLSFNQQGKSQFEHLLRHQLIFHQFNQIVFNAVVSCLKSQDQEQLSTQYKAELFRINQLIVSAELIPAIAQRQPSPKSRMREERLRQREQMKILIRQQLMQAKIREREQLENLLMFNQDHDALSLTEDDLSSDSDYY